MKLTHNILRDQLFINDKLVKAGVAANLLLTNSDFKNSFSVGEDLYIFLPTYGIYKKESKEQVHQKLLLFLTELNLSPYLTKSYILDIAWFLTTVRREAKEISYDYITFQNGNLNLNTMTLEPWSADIISISKLNCDFVPNMEPYAFRKFLDHNFNKETQDFLKAFFRSTITGDTRAQVFLYLSGPGGTGKSTLINLMTMITGDTATLTTTFRDLTQDRFEGLNLVGKRLICINDTDRFQGDLSVVKAITGGDSIVGRIKHQSGSIEIYPRGMLVVSGNSPLQTRDPSGALTRRMRVLQMNQKVSLEDRKPLLHKLSGLWVGPLAEEASAIVEWSRMDQERAYSLLTDLRKTPSVLAMQEEASSITNPLREWVKELLISPGHKSYIGYVPPKSDITYLINLIELKRTLYPSYLLYCHKKSQKALGHVKFVSDLVLTCHTLDIYIERGKDKYGSFVVGLSLDLPIVIDVTGAPDKPSETVEKGEKGDLKEERNTASRLTLRPSLKEGSGARNTMRWKTPNPTLYSQYYALLEKTDLKTQLNQVGKAFRPDPDSLLKNHVHLLTGLEGLKVQGLDYNFGKPSKAFLEGVKDKILLGINKTNKQLIPYKYKPFGLSPRIGPQAYGSSFNSVKKFVRVEAYKYVSSRCPDHSIVDIDLKSCYTSVLIGLFPIDMFNIRKAIEGAGLWDYLEKEFKEAGRKALFNKPAVKICVYSSFFGGGPNAMINGTMDFMRKEIGLIPKEFREAEYYEALHALARDVASFVNRTGVIEDFRSISRYIKKNFDNQVLKGPTDHEYLVNDTLFRSSYPNFLQSFEFYLLAQSTILSLQAFPEAQLIGHYHDGNVVIVPTEQLQPYIEEMNFHLESLRNDLDLAYPQKIEYKTF